MDNCERKYADDTALKQSYHRVLPFQPKSRWATKVQLRSELQYAGTCKARSLAAAGSQPRLGRDGDGQQLQPDLGLLQCLGRMVRQIVVPQ